MPYTTIAQESKHLSELSSDIDKFRVKYVTNEKIEDGSKIQVTFISPTFQVLDKYKYYLYNQSTVENLETKYHYRPDYLSFDKYGTTAFWEVILYINNVDCLEEFNKETVLIPTYQSLSYVIKDISKMDKVVDLSKSEFDESSHQSNGSTFLYRQQVVSKPTRFPQAKKSQVITTVSKNTSPFETETYTLKIPDLRLRYIELSNEAMESYLILRISNRRFSDSVKDLIYGIHYSLIADDNKKLKRVTWNPKIVQTGLLMYLKEDDVIQITYAKKYTS